MRCRGTLLVLLFALVDLRKVVTMETLADTSDPAFKILYTKLDYTTFKTFRLSLEKQLNLPPDLLNNDSVRDLYNNNIQKMRSRSSEVQEPHLEITSINLLGILCALCQDKENTDCIKRYCNRP